MKFPDNEHKVENDARQTIFMEHRDVQNEMKHCLEFVHLFSQEYWITYYSLFSNSFIIHEDQTKEIKNVTVFGYQILNSIDFYDFNF